MLGFKSLKKMFGGLAKTREDLSRRLTEAFRGGTVDAAALEAIEEALIASDVGVATAQKVLTELREAARKRGDLTHDQVRAIVADNLVRALEGTAGSGRAEIPAQGLRVVLVVGVNGGGKTTTVAKLAARFKAEGRSVMLAAADTFRAAATDQLAVWAARSQTPVVRHADGADPAAVVFDAAKSAASKGIDVLIVDTAGRLHTKSNLMEELSKIARVAGREVPGAPHEVLLVLDATTGQNGLAQAREFTRAVPVTGLVVTKLDGTARGGIALAIACELGVPIRYIGVGEGMDDLLDFDPSAYAASLIGEEPAAMGGPR